MVDANLPRPRETYDLTACFVKVIIPINLDITTFQSLE